MYATNDNQQRRANDALTLLVSEMMLPLSIVEAPCFKLSTETLDPRFVVPSRKYFTTTLISQKDEVIRGKHIDILHSSKTVSLTLYLWSNCQLRGFLGIICHFMICWSLKTAMLECNRIKGRHTAENIAQCHDETITFNDIHNKILKTITDNAANVVKRCLPGIENSHVAESESDDDEDVDETTSASVDDDEIREFVTDTFLMHEHDTCFAYSIRLVVKDGMKEMGPDRKLLGKAAAIISHVPKFQTATEVLEGRIRLQSSNAMRWSSEVISIKLILRVPNDKLRLLDAPHLTLHYRSFLQGMVAVVSPFLEATNLT
ncbi:PREDICTED: uncharacterized protein LOC105316683 [Amphimedon queenslandica]|uniref:Uncharacterized protein n=1 Tax=Amphimedon queenslandica TaxID=400682 RepID=A0A1X7VJD7_AMPQE|nr:PREDICTED: uncharacterized protein LOC105316683 [Amphimedon queenslandica]|eukprot:XP_011410067.1 PREDICTED: uncharacterized protein LOC105316683 [Amphimedon queenslandica]